LPFAAWNWCVEEISAVSIFLIILIVSSVLEGGANEVFSFNGLSWSLDCVFWYGKTRMGYAPLSFNRHYRCGLCNMFICLYVYGYSFVPHLLGEAMKKLIILLVVLMASAAWGQEFRIGYLVHAKTTQQCVNCEYDKQGDYVAIFPVCKNVSRDIYRKCLRDGGMELSMSDGLACDIGTNNKGVWQLRVRNKEKWIKLMTVNP
jgi:hypothetical protein